MAEYLVAFGSTHAALSFEEAFGEQGSLVPVPPRVRAGCGMALLFHESSDREAARVACDAARGLGIEGQIDGLFAKESDFYRRVAMG